jgi:deoxyribonuclease V
MLKTKSLHRWDVTPAQAREIQEKLAGRVISEDRLKKRISYVAGVDVGFEDGGATTRAALAVLSFPDLQLYEYAVARLPTAFPYVPGLLSFREAPAALQALKTIRQVPDLLLCDGQGLAHPRRFGLACHIGLLAGIPTIGVAKTRLVGEHGELPTEKGSRIDLLHKGERIGMVVRTRDAVKPVYVSVGHKVSLETAVNYVLRCTTKYRLPETTRWADRIASDKTGRFV